MFTAIVNCLLINWRKEAYRWAETSIPVSLHVRILLAEKMFCGAQNQSKRTTFYWVL